jgi:2-polyprenyl-3-methyl-5-hydroxy-6-metoxy-1,4-benzoquinol methylase
MDYIDYQLQKNSNTLYFWYRARKKLIFMLLNFAYPDFQMERQILDIGSGTGCEIEELSKFGSVTALDQSSEALIIVQQKYNCKIINADIELIELQPNQYDCICCFDVLEHLKNDRKAINTI